MMRWLRRVYQKIHRILGWREFRILDAKKFNWKGPLPDPVTWRWAVDNIVIQPMSIINPPTHCFECNTKLTVKGHDWWHYSNGLGQYMVYTYSCPHGHGAWVEWA